MPSKTNPLESNETDCVSKMNKTKATCDVCHKAFINITQHKTKMHEKHVIILKTKTMTMIYDGKDMTYICNRFMEDGHNVYSWSIENRNRWYEFYYFCKDNTYRLPCMEEINTNAYKNLFEVQILDE